MTVLADYTPDEQRLLLRSLSAAAEVVSAASLGKKAETASEGFAAASYIMESHGEFLDNPLIGSVQYELDRRAKADEKFPDFFKRATAPGAEGAALDILRQVNALLAAKVPAGEAAGYRTWLLNIAQKTAEAGKEGGNFFGRGAVLVNDAERAALAEIAQVLGVQG